MGPVEALAPFVERLSRQVNHEVRHLVVDFAGRLDKACPVVQCSELPGKIVRIERDTMPPQPWARIERDKAKGFGGCRLNNLPDIYLKDSGYLGKLVGQPDIHCPVGILKQL